MVQKQGVLKAYSGRSMERTIGQYKKLIKSKISPGINAGNILERFALFNYIQSLDINITKKLNMLKPRLYSSSTFESIDTNDPKSAQLWSPLSDFSISALPCQISSEDFQNSLSKYNKRASTSISSSSTIKSVLISGRCWDNGITYSSLLYRNHINEKRRGGHYIMFNIPHRTLVTDINIKIVFLLIFFFHLVVTQLLITGILELSSFFSNILLMEIPVF